VGDRRPAATTLKCPRCGERDLAVEEHLEASTEWVITGGQFDVSEGINETGNITGYSVTCDRCDHHWRLRGSFFATVKESAPQVREEGA
jgi:uncharacterized C2H2 Zn-finger protein